MTTSVLHGVQKHPRYRVQARVDVVTSAADIIELETENLSLGGMFVKTTAPPPIGTPLRLRLRHELATLGLAGTVVHVLDEQAAKVKLHPPGMGIQFGDLPPKTEEMLKQLVEELAALQEKEKARSSSARFLGPTVVQVSAAKEAVQHLWKAGLNVGGLYVDGGGPEKPALGAIVRVLIGPVELTGEVVHVDARGAGLQMRDFAGPKRDALQKFAEGEGDVLAYREIKVPAGHGEKLLAAARRLFTGIEENDPFGALGLTNTATEDEVRQRCDVLRRAFAAPPADASPPQLARIASAAKALEDLKPRVLQRAQTLRREAELVTQPQRSRAVDDAVRGLLAEAAEAERRHEKEREKKILEKVVEIAPDHEAAVARLAAVEAAIDLARALDLINKAEVFIQGVGMKEQAIENAREAARLSAKREVRLRCLRVLAKSGELGEATILAEELVATDGKDPLALQSLMLLQEKAEKWAQAARTGEQLLRLKPSDDELHKRVKKLVEYARKPPPPSTRIPSGRWSFNNKPS